MAKKIISKTSRGNSRVQSYRLQEDAIAKVKRISFNLTKTERGKSGTVNEMINFCNANIASFEAWFRGVK